MQFAKTILSDFKHLFYPHLCSGCGTDVLSDDTILCARCYMNLPRTGFAAQAGNPVEKIFWGRLLIQAAHSEFYFTKNTVIQHLIHQLKYKGDKETGMYLGQMMGRSIMESGRFKDIEAMVPLPMFPDKERKRGYNQAAVIANGMSEIMQIPVFTDVLLRERLTETQTKKHRVERWENVEDSFVLKNQSAVQGKHLLLVDDVITTGATLEAGGRQLVKINGVKLSITTLATAVK